MEHTARQVAVALGLDLVEDVDLGPAGPDGIRMPREVMPIQAGVGLTAESGSATVDSPTTIIGVRRLVPDLIERE
jgi:hypothetical protein